jgi:hypothetical protein
VVCVIKNFIANEFFLNSKIICDSKCKHFWLLGEQKIRSKTKKIYNKQKKPNKSIHVFHEGQGVTKRCRLSLLTNSALVYGSQCGGMGGLAGSQPMSTAVHTGIR